MAFAPLRAGSFRPWENMASKQPLTGCREHGNAALGREILVRIALAAVLVSLLPSSAWAWWSTSWGLRRKITLNNSGQPSNLLNFPLLVRLDSTRVECISAAGSPEIEVDEEGTVKASSSPRRLLESVRVGGFAPNLWARLVETLFRGETKKARHELAPLRHDPVSGRTVLARRLTVRVEFFGVEPSERSLGGSRGRRARPSPVRGLLSVLAHLTVQEPGLYRMRFEDVLGPGHRGVNARSLRLSRPGQPVPYHLEPDGALFAPGSSLFFLSEGCSKNPRGDVARSRELRQRISPSA
jgi:hypothetical protein